MDGLRGRGTCGREADWTGSHVFAGWSTNQGRRARDFARERRRGDPTAHGLSPDVATVNWFRADLHVRAPWSPEVKLPKHALERVHLGQSFAEYDTTLEHTSVFVHTPALVAASKWENPHCFFVGRRGTGKTTIARYVEKTSAASTLIRPELFSPSSSQLPVEEFKDAKQKPFRSLTAAFRRSLQAEVLLNRLNHGHLYERHLSPGLLHEIQTYGDLDFDLRAVAYIDALTSALAQKDDLAWLTEVKVPKQMAKDLGELTAEPKDRYTVLVDAIDDSWDGSELAVVYLSALMHAALEVNTQTVGIRVLIFVRENIFERIRLADSEFARLETCVVGLEWTAAQLLELIERRLNAPLTAKVALGGATWDAFIEAGPTSRQVVFDFCQRRPRDVLTYVGLALDTAQSQRHEQIKLEDLQAARRRFSTSRLKDLGDEYQENYPQLSLVLSRFYGLGGKWTLQGLSGLLERLMVDDQVRTACSSWIFEFSTPDQFARLLYSIGFLGIQPLSRRTSSKKLEPIFRSLGPSDTTPPPVSSSTDLLVHHSFWDALDLQDTLIQEFDAQSPFGRQGLQFDLPGALDFEVHQERLKDLQENLRTLPTGNPGATQLEGVVGDMLELCFFRNLANVEPQSRDVDGTIRRDWIAANRGTSGFWEMIRQRYDATQVIWECKNYEDLGADDFHQAAYYMSAAGGKFVIIVFRGEIKKHHYEHVKRIVASSDGMVMLLNDKDLQVFIRQAINGKVRDDHLQDRYDAVVRAVS